ncbi:hypothetical protein PENPOL_c007G06884 [Penicillium polonicum]|uniref:Uncharacterized protein n=1 Tax=Penicillium polonicum TaxID=60169 RepID=A0A1V6NJ37_PENPO|nr:hypothetical protein PENPOL_c007G06884 [Penicillium polonicum]
MLYLVKIKVI